MNLLSLFSTTVASDVHISSLESLAMGISCTVVDKMKLSLLTKKRDAIMEIIFIIVFINNFEAPFKLLLVLLLSLPIDHKRIKSKRCYETSFFVQL